jgi:hypothetical protein
MPQDRRSYKVVCARDYSGVLPVVDALDGLSAGPAVWTGWIWTGKAWEAVCSADGLGRCANELNRLAETRGVTRSLWQILTREGKPPAAPPTAPPQKRRAQ